MRNGIHFIRGSQWIALAALFLLCTIIADAETITYNFSIDDFEITRENGVTFVKSKDSLASDLEDVPLVSSYFTVSITKENSLPYIATVAVIKDKFITTSEEINADMILIGPNLQIRDSGDLHLRGKEIIQTPGIIIESGGNLNIYSNGKD